jgi:hypothetical protein
MPIELKPVADEQVFYDKFLCDKFQLGRGSLTKLLFYFVATMW